jgi:hypothetical protein
MQGNAGGMQAERWDQPAPAWSAVRFANGYRGREHEMDASSQQQEDAGLPLDTPHWNYTNTFGFGVVSALNSTHLHYQVVPVSGGIGTDEFLLVRETNTV